MKEVDTSDPDACHEWPRYRSRGYGRFTFGVGNILIVSRVVLANKLGRPIADGMLACHVCDNPPCCNERHLYEGTVSDNASDARLRRQLKKGGG